MKTIQEIAQWVIDNRYPKSENDKVSDFEMYHALIEAMNQALIMSDVMQSLPDSDEIRMKAQELDEKDFDQWWWEKVYEGNVL